MCNLVGKRILVTGAGTGIGQGIAIECGRAGAAVVLHYAHNKAGAEEAVAAISSAGGPAHCVSADLAQVSECQSLVREAARLLGGLDGIVNNAGVTREVPFLETDEQVYNSVADLNMRGYFFCAQEASRLFVAARGGVILNITSGQAAVGVDRHAAYASTKGAIVSFTRELAIELAPMGVRVNAIGPGLIEVPRIVNRQAAADGSRGYNSERAASTIPLRRVGQPSDIGDAAVFLLSDSASYITGQVLYVDGGITAQVPSAF